MDMQIKGNARRTFCPRWSRALGVGAVGPSGKSKAVLRLPKKTRIEEGGRENGLNEQKKGCTCLHMSGPPRDEVRTRASHLLP